MANAALRLCCATKVGAAHTAECVQGNEIDAVAKAIGVKWDADKRRCCDSKVNEYHTAECDAKHGEPETKTAGERKCQFSHCDKCGTIDRPLTYSEKDVLCDECSKGQQGHPAFLAILNEIRSLHVRKAADYGTATDLFANMRTDDFGVEAWRYAVLQCKNKMKRLQAYCQNGRLANEGVEDTFLDLAAYAIIGLALHREASK